MIFPNNLASLKRSAAALFLCGLAPLCSCAPQSRTPSVETVLPTAPARVAESKMDSVKAPPTPVKTPTEETAVVTPHVSDHDLPNFHAVTPVLFRSAAPTPQGLETLQKIGIKTVIDLRIAPKTVAKERAQLDRMGVHYLNLPMSGDPPSDREIQTFLTTIADPAQQPVLVHCQHGADRTGTMIGIYREHVIGWSYDKTYKEMLKYGFNPHWKKLSATVRRFAPSDTSH